MGVAWLDGLTYRPTGTFADVAHARLGLAAVLAPGGLEAPLTTHDIDQLDLRSGAWPRVRRGPTTRIVPVRDRGFRSAGRTIMALLVAGEGGCRRTIAVDRFELILIEAAEEARSLTELLREAMVREPRSSEQVVASLRRLASVGALLARWPQSDIER